MHQAADPVLRPAACLIPRAIGHTLALVVYRQVHAGLQSKSESSMYTITAMASFQRDAEQPLRVGFALTSKKV
jgi:ABC-type phosphate transport system permease subunit